MIRYDGEVVYSESGSGIRANNRMLLMKHKYQRLKQSLMVNSSAKVILAQFTLLKIN